ncbi:MAG TPA: hypothetical protein VMX17_07210 [Candidatus Glassbacteria bacterium]|nr:hypothetical protein [Candidatus Glassbacteria bacterium]
MSNKKNAQLIDFPSFGGGVVLEEDKSKEEDDFPTLEDGAIPRPGEVVELEPRDDEKEIVFSIGLVPGAPDEVVLDEDEEEPEIVKEGPKEEIDEWNWEKSHGVGKFLHWLKGMIDNVPGHSGKHITGIQRATAYFKRLEKEVGRAMSKDFKREIDAAKAQEASNIIKEGLKNLNNRLNKLLEKEKKSRGEYKVDITKIAETSTLGNIQIVVPYMVSLIARACIDASVQGGKDMKDTFEKLGKEYKLDKREEAQVIHLIKDMGYPLMIDRLRLLDDSLKTDGDGEFIKNYPA